MAFFPPIPLIRKNLIVRKLKKCNAFSEDCVNMWQLMSFDEIIQKGGRKDGY